MWKSGGSGHVIDSKGQKIRCTYTEAFAKIRELLHAGAVLQHIDYEAAQDYKNTGRPLELFIDASDYGWCGCLTQRDSPHSAPRIVAIVAKAFDQTQLNWSAMERELYALWQGTLAMESTSRECS